MLLSGHNVSSEYNDVEKSSSILQSQNTAESRHEPRGEIDDLADHHEVATHMTTTPGPSSPVILSI